MKRETKESTTYYRIRSVLDFIDIFSLKEYVCECYFVEKETAFFLCAFSIIFCHTYFTNKYGERQTSEIVLCDMEVRGRWKCGESGFVWA